MKYILNRISYLPATCFGLYNWNHIQAELSLKMVPAVGFTLFTCHESP
jgi:hypothetical protein